MNDKEVLALTKEFQRNYLKTGRIISAIDMIESKSDPEKTLKRIAKETMLSGEPSHNTSNSSFGEFLEILLFGIDSGKNISKNLEFFIHKLENEISKANRIKSKVSGLNLLTYAGMVFFIPLFGGISATILTTSLNLMNSSMQVLKERFLLVIDAYTSIILYTNRFFSHPFEGMMKRLYAIAPFCAISTIVLIFTSSFVANLL